MTDLSKETSSEPTHPTPEKRLFDGYKWKQRIKRGQNIAATWDEKGKYGGDNYDPDNPNNERFFWPDYDGSYRFLSITNPALSYDVQWLDKANEGPSPSPANSDTVFSQPLRPDRRVSALPKFNVYVWFKDLILTLSRSMEAGEELYIEAYANAFNLAWYNANSYGDLNRMGNSIVQTVMLKAGSSSKIFRTAVESVNGNQGDWVAFEMGTDGYYALLTTFEAQVVTFWIREYIRWKQISGVRMYWTTRILEIKVDAQQELIILEVGDYCQSPFMIPEGSL
ncbi:uncharacterized protein N7459_003587 [Penicillium hispanicum]|uniref:uncharacterized protein n=1 Tax=Penicillium hispanicum TaxID=1080232 RepID=UPI00253FA53F|nr:uncharacterized protein N7459_003587 [Penicillium hispanicum]KAJ5587822.1 hypothetical protein N7459_003587 [Penicillium hispanicum]